MERQQKKKKKKEIIGSKEVRSYDTHQSPGIFIHFLDLLFTSTRHLINLLVAFVTRNSLGCLYVYYYYIHILPVADFHQLFSSSNDDKHGKAPRINKIHLQILYQVECW